ncbi:MAG: hypothetical protein AB1429_03995 [Pseudomonadota bacterium]|jgi:hypothetical protein
MDYHEIQRLPLSPVLIAPSLLLVVLAISGWFIIPASSKILFYTTLSIPIILFGLLSVTFRIETRITPKAVTINASIFGRETIPISEISKVEEIQYNPIRDFGGWGVRSGLGGKIYSASGDRAVKIILKSHKIIYIGTQHPKELVASIAYP